MIDSLTSSAAFPWVAAGLVGAVALIAICGFLSRSKIKIGKIRIGTIRPQILVVLAALSLIAFVALRLDEGNVTSLAVGGMIALATRIIEKDSGSNKG